jgi:hypothetical protein
MPSRRLKDAVDARIAPVLVIDVDRAKEVEVTAAEPREHGRKKSALGR